MPARFERAGDRPLTENRMSKLDENIAKAKAYLAKFENGVMNRINGEDVWAADGSTYETISPVDLKPLAKVALGKRAGVSLKLN